MFDSKAEARRWCELKLMEQAGLISGLTRQKSFELAPSVIVQGRKRPALRYVADFTYFNQAGSFVVCDVKGKLTQAYIIKRHLMKSVHGIDILETK